jgi:hypothetical protein
LRELKREREKEWERGGREKEKKRERETLLSLIAKDCWGHILKIEASPKLDVLHLEREHNIISAIK